MKTAITPTRAENFSEWYQNLIVAADLAENAPVRGCMTIKPYGWAIWELMRDEMDRRIKSHGVQNANFPLLIPIDFFNKEAEHVAGFAKECAVVTHHRLKMIDGTLQPDPDSKLTEPYIIRPTSETIIGEAMSRWVQSYRDLPLKLNQWVNVIRWEMRPRMFLRTSEFNWQEGHNVFATHEEANADARKMHKMYGDYMRDVLAIPSIMGEKTPEERFAGADHTYTLEHIMQDGKALQAGTSHDLGQHFSKSFGIQFLGNDGKLQHGWTTSWGTTTRMMGSMFMIHSDDDGLILPPSVAPYQVVIIPIRQQQEGVLDKAYELKNRLSNFRVKVDDTDKSPGWKFSEQEMRGIPVRVEIGPKDIEANKCVICRRDTREKIEASLDELETVLQEVLDEMQVEMLERAREHREEHTYVATNYDDFKKIFNEKAGFVKAMWCGERACEDKVKEDLSVTSRCMPFEQEELSATCVCCGKPAKKMVYWGRAY